MCLFFFTNMQKTKKYQEGPNTTNWMFMDDFRIFSTRNLSFCSNIYTIESEGYRLRRGVGWAIKLFIILQVLLELLWNWMFASLKQSLEWFAKKNGWESKWWMVHPACSATIRVPFSKALNLQQFSVQCPGNTGKSNMHRWSFPDLLHSHCYLSDFGVRFKTWRQIMQIIQFYRVFERKNVPYYNNADKSTNKQQNK